MQHESAMDCRRWAWPLACCLWACLVLVTIVRAGIMPDKNNCFVDHYRPAGLNWLHGVELYEKQADTCRYSPIVHAVLVPFAILGDRWGTVVWRALGDLLLMGALLWWLRAVCPPELTIAQRALLLGLALPLAIGSVNNGQANVLMMAGILAGMAAVAERRWNVAAVALGFACFLKLYPIALVLLLLVVYPRQLGWRFAFVLAIGMLTPFILQNPIYVAHQYQHWLTNLLVDDRSAWDLSEAYRDVWMLIRVTGLPIQLFEYRVVQVAIGAALAFLCSWMARHGMTGRDLLNRILTLGCCWMTAFGPATESPTYILLSPALAWLLLEAWRGAIPRWTRVPLLLAAVLLFGTVAAVAMPFGRTVLAMGPQPVAALLILATMGVLCLNVPNREAVADSHAPVYALSMVRERAA